MRIIYVFILLTFFAQEIFAQISPVLDFDRSQITVLPKGNVDTLLQVYRGRLVPAKLLKAEPIIGEVISRKDTVIFLPFVPFAYERYYSLIQDGEVYHFKIDLPTTYERLEVQGVFPSKKELPANLLKWYIDFSQPVSPANIYQNIHLVDANGETLERAILPFENALLSEDKKRLTLWMEPGRQKRGLGPSEILGSIFEEGKNYSLLVSKELKDENGVSMVENFTHHFKIVAPDRKSPDAKNWKTEIPKSNTMDSLVVIADESLDAGSALSGVHLQDEDGDKILGEWKLEAAQTRLVFYPAEKWQRGMYSIIFQRTIEDLAGNNLVRLFDGTIQNIIEEDYNLVLLGRKIEIE